MIILIIYQNIFFLNNFLGNNFCDKINLNKNLYKSFRNFLMETFERPKKFNAFHLGFPMEVSHARVS